MRKKLLAMLLAVVLAVGLLPGTALAADAPTSGTCGENVTWSYSDGVLTIEGTGPMYDYGDSAAPWVMVMFDIHTIIIGNSVTSIGENAFYANYFVTSVTIPDSVTSIGEGAFSACRGMTSVTIPNSVISIGYRAFSSCESLKSVTIPSSVTSIGEGAFSGCYRLASVTIENPSVKIGDRAFPTGSPVMDMTLTIHGYTGSTAQDYADNNNDLDYIIFEALDALNTEPTEPTEPETPALPTKFTDVPAGEYYTSAVAWAVDNGIAKGTGGKKFSPAQTCTEAQILTMLWRAEGKPAAEASNLTVDSAYQKAVDWAYAKGMIGDDFDPNADCDRATAVYYIWMARGSQIATAKSFKDVDPDADYADAVSWAVANKITNGTSSKKFSPKQTCERGMIVTLLYRAYK